MGQDGTATINGLSYYSADNSYDFGVGGGVATIAFADGFLGAFDDLTVESSRSATSLEHANYASVGSDSAVIQSGEVDSRADNRYIFSQNGVEVAVTFASGFLGEFDSFTVAAGGQLDVVTNIDPLTGRERQTVRESLTDLFELASGGRFSTIGDGGARSLAVAVEALASLRTLNGGVSISRTGRFLDRFV